MLRLKSFFKVKFRSVVLGCLLYRNRHVCGSIPIEIPIFWTRAVMVGPRPRVLLTLPLLRTIPPHGNINSIVYSDGQKKMYNDTTHENGDNALERND